MMRTTKARVMFNHPFKLGLEDEIYPAGSYLIETDEELLQEISFPAYRRTATWMQKLNDKHPAHVMPIITVDPLQLEDAIFRDKGWNL